MEEKRISKYQKPFRIVFAVCGVLILACLAVMTATSIDEPWWVLIWIFGGMVALEAVVPVLTAMFGVKHLLQLREGTREVADKVFDRFASVLTVVLAVLALASMAASMAGQYWIDPAYPWSATDLFAKLQELSLAFGVLSLLPFVAGWIVKKINRDKKMIRICAGCLTLCITLAVLLVPTQRMHYNDGGGNPARGSERYEALLYEIIVWDRTHEFDGTPVEQVEQHTRVYVFPFDCYEYKAKWDMKH